jgi:hypothetical protein
MDSGLSAALSTLFEQRFKTLNDGDIEAYRALFAPDAMSRVIPELRPDTVAALAAAYNVDGIQERVVSVQITIESGELTNLIFVARLRYQTITPDVIAPETSEMLRLRGALLRTPSGWLISSIELANDASSDPDSDESSPTLNQISPETQFPETTPKSASESEPVSAKCDSKYLYDTSKAIGYLDLWADGFNSEYPSYEDVQGFRNDCTNFASQVLLAGGRKMLFGTQRDWNVWWYQKPKPPDWLGWPDKNHFSFTWTLSRGLFFFLGMHTATESVLTFADFTPGDVVFVDASNKSYDPGSGPDGFTEHTMFVHERICSGDSFACILVSYHSSLPVARKKKSLKTFDIEEKAIYQTKTVKYYALRPLPGCPLVCANVGDSCVSSSDCCVDATCTAGVCSPIACSPGTCPQGDWCQPSSGSCLSCLGGCSGTHKDVCEAQCGSSASPSCFDKIKNQNEVSTDCGGVCTGLPGYCPYGPKSDGWYCGDPSRGQDPGKLYYCAQGSWDASKTTDCGAAGCDTAAPCHSDSCNGSGVPPSLNATLLRLRTCATEEPITTRVFTSKTALHGLVDVTSYAQSGCFIADTAEDSFAPSAEPDKSTFRAAFEAANPQGVLGRQSPFVEIAKSLAQSLKLPEAAFVHCASTCANAGVRATSWYGHSYILSPVTTEGQQAILQVTGTQAALAVHPILYFDSLLPELWYFASAWNTNCVLKDASCGSSCAANKLSCCPLDIDNNAMSDDNNDHRWLDSQINVLDMVRSTHNVGIVGHVTGATAACKFAPHLDGMDTELGTYAADADGARFGEPRKPVSFLRAWEHQSRLCYGGPCYRAVFTSADPSLDVQLDGTPFPWDRPEIWYPGGIMDQMKADTARINAGHALAALVGGAAFPGTTYFWGTGPFGSPWIDVAAGRPARWLGKTITEWSRLQSTIGNPIEVREYEHGVVLWNDGPNGESVSMSGWLGSSANLAGTNADAEGLVVSSVALAPRSGVVLRRPQASVGLPPVWLDPNVINIPIAPGESTKPLRVTLYYQPDPSVVSVNELESWADGISWGPLTTNCNLSLPGPVHCDAKVGCLVTAFAAGAKLTLVNDPNEQYPCYASPPGQFHMRGSAWIETNHGKKVMLTCKPCDPPQDPLWCSNMQIPQGVLLE